MTPLYQPTPTVLFRSYMSTVLGSTDSRMFKHFYTQAEGAIAVDVLEGGALACAYYVTSILTMFGLLDHPHTTVSGTDRALLESGWALIDSPRVGCVIVWAALEYEDGPHKHIGFYAGGGMAISNSTTEGIPKSHDWQFRRSDDGSARAVAALYWHQSLE